MATVTIVPVVKTYYGNLRSSIKDVHRLILDSNWIIEAEWGFESWSVGQYIRRGIGRSATPPILCIQCCVS